MDTPLRARIGVLTLLLSLISIPFQAAHAQDVRPVKSAPPIRMVPASLHDAERNLQSLIIFPEEHELVGNLFVRCQAFINENRRVFGAFCYRGDAISQPFESAVLHATERAFARPAIVKKDEKTVWLQFGVLFKAQEERAIVYQTVNPSELRYGQEVSGPQRYKTSRKCPIPRHNTTNVVRYRVFANAQNQVLAAGRSGGRGASDRLTKQFTKCFGGMKYIPAQIRGEWVDSAVAEPMFSLSVARPRGL